MGLHSIDEFTLPLAREVTVGGRGVRERSGLFVTLADDAGAYGVGEIAPLPGVHQETLSQCRERLLDQRPELQVRAADRVAPDAGMLEWGSLFLALDPYADLPSVQFGLAMAALNLAASQRGAYPARLLNRDSLPQLPVNALVMAPPDQWMAATGQRIAEGFSVIKLKVGRSPLKYEAQVLRALQNRSQGEASFVLDGNRAWSLSQAEAFLTESSTSCIRYGEELLQNPGELAELQRRVGIPMALDETLWTSDHDTALIRDWPSLFVLKVDRIPGTLEAALRLSAAAHAKGQSVVVSSAFNTPLGLSFLVQLGAALHCPHAGLDTQRLFPDALAFGALRPVGGAIPVQASWLNSTERFKPYLRKVRV